MQKKKIFILSCGTNACFNLIRECSENFSDQIEVYGADTTPPEFLASLHYLKEFYRVSPNSSEGYYDEILNILRVIRPDYIIPSFDRDQLLFYPSNPELRSLGIESLGPDYPILDSYQNKTQINEFLRKNGYPVPETYEQDALFDEREYFVKPIDGVGSVGAIKLSGREIKSQEFLKQHIIQELCFGPEVTVECFKYNDFFSCICRQRVSTKSGVANKVRVFEDPQLENIVKTFSELSGIPRIFNLQFMKSSLGEWRITDVNLRMAGGGHLSVACGWNSYRAICGSLLKDKNIASCFHKDDESFVSTIQAHIVTKMTKFKLVFDLDGTILNSEERHIIVLDELLEDSSVDLDTSSLMRKKKEGASTFEYLIANNVEEIKAKVISKKWIESIELARFIENDRLYPGTREMLLKLFQKSDIYLLTARKDKKLVESQLRKLHILDFFKEIIVVDPVNSAIEKAKYLELIRPELFVGDTETDKLAADRTSIDFYPVNYGFRSKNFWDKRNIVSHSLKQTIRDLLNLYS